MFSGDGKRATLAESQHSRPLGPGFGFPKGFCPLEAQVKRQVTASSGTPRTRQVAHTVLVCLPPSKQLRQKWCQGCACEDRQAPKRSLASDKLLFFLLFISFSNQRLDQFPKFRAIFRVYRHSIVSKEQSIKSGRMNQTNKTEKAKHRPLH